MKDLYIHFCVQADSVQLRFLHLGPSTFHSHSVDKRRRVFNCAIGHTLREVTIMQHIFELWRIQVSQRWTQLMDSFMRKDLRLHHGLQRLHMCHMSKWVRNHGVQWNGVSKRNIHVNNISCHHIRSRPLMLAFLRPCLFVSSVQRHLHQRIDPLDWSLVQLPCRRFGCNSGREDSAPFLRLQRDALLVNF